MTQTHAVIERLLQQWPDLNITIEQISTKGDHVTDVPVTQLGGDGIFVTEIECALRDGRIDLAVHSLKDLPTTQAGGLCLVVTGPREDVRDVIVWNDSSWQEMRCKRDGALGEQAQILPYADQRHTSEYGRGDPLRHLVWGTGMPWSLSSPRSPRLGTCSLRRMAQLRVLWSGVEILPLRGNVDTRLRKLDAGDYDGIVLAAAGLHRLRIQERLASRLSYMPVEVMMPAPGQGALALETRTEPEIQALVAPLQDLSTHAAASAERAFMRRLGAGCYLPVAAYGEITSEMLTLQGLVISLDGQVQVRVCQSMSWTRGTTLELAEQLGVKLAEQALQQGAAEIITAMDIRRTGVQEHV